MHEHDDKCANVSVKDTFTYSTWAGCIQTSLVYIIQFACGSTSIIHFSPLQYLGCSHQRNTNDDKLLYYDISNNLLDFHIYNFIADEINTILSGSPMVSSIVDQ